MVQETALRAEPREGTGKEICKKIRTTGRIPGVVYGLSKPCANVTVDAHDLEQLVAHAGAHAMIALQIGERGSSEHVLLRDMQRDPITDRLVHADFHRIDPSKPIQIEVPIAFTGVAVGVKEGGLLERLMRTILVKCLPVDMPAVLEFDVSEIRIGHSLHVRDVTAPAGVEILASPETALFTVLAPRKVEEEVAAAEVAEVVEPEVVGKEEKEEAEEGEKPSKE